MLIILDGERPRSWNAFYAGTHWSDREELANSIHDLVSYTVLEQHPGVVPFEKRVRITVRAYFKNRPQDADNVTAKFYIDGLHGLVIHDDTIKYVASVTTESHVDNKNPRVEIEVVEE